MKKLALALAAALAARSANAEPASPGEETVLAVRYLGVPTGEGRISIGQPSGDVLPVFFLAKTGGAVAFLDIKEHLVSYWDRTSNLPRGSDLKAVELGEYHEDQTRFDRQSNKVTVVIQRKGEQRVKTGSIPADAHDITSAFLYLRFQPLAVGQRYELPVCSGVDCFTLVAEVLDREKVQTPMGPFDTLKLKVRTQLKGNFSTKRDTYLWLSNDPRHVLVQMSADFAVGAIVATIKSYKPGTQVAAAR